MKASFNRFFILILTLSFTCPGLAQDNPAVLKDAAPASLNKQDTLLLKNSGLIKKDTVKKAVASSDSTPPAKSHFQVNVVYESNDVYLGRADSTVLPLVTPEISYIFKSGFEIDFSVGINVAAPSPQVNSWTLDGSYSFNPGNYSGSVTLSWFNYSVNSGSVNASQNGSLAYNNSYDFGFIEPSLNLTWTFDSIPDYQVSFALQHEFDFLNNGNLSLTPTVTINGSTQQFYNSYYKKKRFTIPRPGKPPLPENVSISGEVLNSEQFQILDYELSAPINFTAGKWSFNYTPTYAIPVNPPDISLTVKTNNQTLNKTYKQSLSNIFYSQLGVTYSF